MSDQAQGPGWWLASDGRWYPPQPPQPPPPPVQFQPAKSSNGCVVALAVVGALVVLAFGALVAIGLLVGSDAAAPRVAGRDNGVTIDLREFDQIRTGMTLDDVEQIVGGAGALVSSAGDGEFRAEIYSWDGTGSIGANANVSLQGGLVIGKAQFGLG